MFKSTRMIFINDNHDNIDNSWPTTATAVCGVRQPQISCLSCRLNYKIVVVNK